MAKGRFDILSPRQESCRQALLHVFPSFAIGGVPLRMARILNHFGRLFSHTILALDGKVDAAAHLSADLDVNIMQIPSWTRAGTLRSVIGAARFLHENRPDLLLTYNWGAIEWALANTLLPVARHIHLEAGFGKEEADRQIRRRVLLRRLGLSRCSQVVVPSRKLEGLARKVWQLRPEIVTYLPNGVDPKRFANLPCDAVPGFTRQPRELVIGTLAPLRPEKNVGRLIHVFATLTPQFPTRLIIAGDGGERGALARLAAELGIADRVIFTGEVKPEAVLGTFDIFALSSDTEQMPNALLEAMAGGRAVAAVDVGDVGTIVSEENRRFIVPRDDHPAFAKAINDLLCDAELRRDLGRINRERAIAEFSQERMFARYAQLFANGDAQVHQRDSLAVNITSV